MTLLDQLLPASYKKAEFLISTSAVAGGRKDQRHEFPNSNKQTIEDLGLRPRVYRMVGWIVNTATTGADGYKVKRDRLLAALESDSSGVLSHPFYGLLPNIKCREFTASENLTDLGRFEISMTFEHDDILGTPEATENTIAKLTTANDVVQKLSGDEIAGNFKVDTKFLGNFTAAKSKLTDLKDGYDSASSVVVKATANINSFNSLVSDFGNNINSLILAPRALADAIVNIGSGLNGLYATSKSQIIAWQELFGFGELDGTIATTTAGLAQRDKNNKVINTVTNTQALSYTYLAGGQNTFDNTQQLDEFAQVLETQYQGVLDDSVLSNDLLDALSDMRRQTSAFFDQARVTLNRVTTINTAQLPARYISFQYYGEDTFGEEIAQLNKNANVSFLNGDIKVVSV